MEVIFELTFLDTLVKFPVLVGPLGLSCILGLDFMEKDNCTLQLKRSISQVGLKEQVLHKEHSEHCCRVKIAETVVVDPQAQVVLPGLLQSGRWNTAANIGMVEPVSSFIESTGLLVGKALVNTESGRVLLSLMDVSEEPVMVLKGTTVALVQPVGKVNRNPPTSQESHQDDGRMESDSRDGSTISDPGAKELGVTPLVRHVIDTGDAQSIKLLLRPWTQQCICDLDTDKLLERGG